VDSSPLFNFLIYLLQISSVDCLIAHGAMEKEFDLVIFGATGFTGQYVIREVANVTKEDAYKSLKWAVAGRSEEKIRLVLDIVAEDTGEFPPHRL
jgi:short subunit dehydrogenase-like uncharacterized protein